MIGPIDHVEALHRFYRSNPPHIKFKADAPKSATTPTRVSLLLQARTSQQTAATATTRATPSTVNGNLPVQAQRAGQAGQRPARATEPVPSIEAHPGERTPDPGKVGPDPHQEAPDPHRRRPDGRRRCRRSNRKMEKERDRGREKRWCGQATAAAGGGGNRWLFGGGEIAQREDAEGHRV